MTQMYAQRKWKFVCKEYVKGNEKIGQSVCLCANIDKSGLSWSFFAIAFVASNKIFGAPYRAHTVISYTLLFFKFIIGNDLFFFKRMPRVKEHRKREREGAMNLRLVSVFLMLLFFSSVSRRTSKYIYIFVILRLAAQTNKSPSLTRTQEKVEKMCMKCNNKTETEREKRKKDWKTAGKEWEHESNKISTD